MRLKKVIRVLLTLTMVLSIAGCQNSSSKKTTIEIISYKQEAATYFDKVAKEFNATHTDIKLKISSPNDAVTVMKTRFIREDYPDIIAYNATIFTPTHSCIMEAVFYDIAGSGLLAEKRNMTAAENQVGVAYLEFTIMDGTLTLNSDSTVSIYLKDGTIKTDRPRIG